MNNKGKLILLIILIALLFGGSYNLYQRLSLGTAPQKTEAAPSMSTEPAGDESTEQSDNSSVLATPDFTVYDADGNKVTFSSFLGKPVVVNFWASWCNPCQSELPYYQEAFEKYGEDVNFMMVDLTGNGGDNIKNAQDLITDNSYSFPVYYDNDNDAAVQYGISPIPVSCFITADGNIQDMKIGAMSEENLIVKIEALLPAD